MRESRYTAEGVTHPLQPAIWEACDRLNAALGRPEYSLQDSETLRYTIGHLKPMHPADSDLFYLAEQLTTGGKIAPVYGAAPEPEEAFLARLEGMLAGVALARRMMTALAPAPMEIVP